MIFYYKVAKAKKLFLLRILFFSLCVIKNSYAHQTDLGQLVRWNLPGIVLCGVKVLLPQTANAFLGSTQLADLITYGPGVVPQLIMIGCNGLINLNILNIKKKIFMKKNPDNTNLSKRKNFNKPFVIVGLGEVVLCYLIQYSLLWYKNKLNAKHLSYAGIYALINVMPSLYFIFRKQYAPSAKDLG